MKNITRHLYFWVLLAIVFGALYGYVFPERGVAMKPLGDGFIGLVKMLIAPVIFCTVVLGIAGMSDMKKVGRVGAKAMLEVLARAKSTDKDKIRDAALAYRAPMGSTAAGWGIQFNETGQNTAATLNLMQWQQGKLATVFPEGVANAKPVATN